VVPPFFKPTASHLPSVCSKAHITPSSRFLAVRSQEINARSDKGLKAIEGVVGALRQKLHRIATDVARTRGVIDALKERTREVG
jgi:hypothetical protein